MDATGITINDYQLTKLIRGDNVYSGRHTRTGEEVEIKVEPVQAEHPVLQKQASVHIDVTGIVGIPSIHWFGDDGVRNAMVTDLMGPTLEDLFQYCHRKFSLKTVLLFAVQALTRLENFHEASYIHCKIRPSSFFVGLDKWGNQFSMGDLSHAKRYTVQGSDTPNPQVTCPYASLNTHRGMAQSPRDDLESLAYVMYYFCRGCLPWQDEDIELVMEQKRNMTPEELFHEFPVEFGNYLKYVQSLHIDDKPDYSFLREQFWSLFARESFQNDHVFDWTVTKYPGNGATYTVYGESQLLAQPEVTPLSREQLVDIAEEIYDAVSIAERKCVDGIERLRLMGQRPSDEDWQGQFDLQREYLYKLYDLLASLCSSPPAHPREATVRDIPNRMWRYGIHGHLEFLQLNSPESSDHMLAFLNLAYRMVAVIMEMVPAFEEIWPEVLGDLSRYCKAFEVDSHRRKIWFGVAARWYAKAADKSPNVGRIQHHLAVVARPDIIRQLFHYSNALVSVTPFPDAQGTITQFFKPFLSETAGRKYPWAGSALVGAHAVLFTQGSTVKYEYFTERFLSELYSYIGDVTAEFKVRGPEIASILCAATFGFGNGEAYLLQQFCAEHDRKMTQPQDHPASHGQKEPPQVTKSMTATNATFSGTHDITADACQLFFETISVVLQRVGDDNIVPFMHVVLVYLCGVASVPSAFTYIEKRVPSEEIAAFLNTLCGSAGTDTQFHGEHSSEESSDMGKYLPEDFIMRGLTWAQYYFPPDFFQNVRSSTAERMMEQPHHAVCRIRRILRLANRLVSTNQWLKYNQVTHTFSAAPSVTLLVPQFEDLRREGKKLEVGEKAESRSKRNEKEGKLSQPVYPAITQFNKLEGIVPSRRVPHLRALLLSFTATTLPTILFIVGALVYSPIDILKALYSSVNLVSTSKETWSTIGLTS